MDQSCDAGNNTMTKQTDRYYKETTSALKFSLLRHSLAGKNKKRQSEEKRRKKKESKKETPSNTFGILMPVYGIVAEEEASSSSALSQSRNENSNKNNNNTRQQTRWSISAKWKWVAITIFQSALFLCRLLYLSSPLAVLVVHFIACLMFPSCAVQLSLVRLFT